MEIPAGIPTAFQATTTTNVVWILREGGRTDPLTLRVHAPGYRRGASTALTRAGVSGSPHRRAHARLRVRPLHPYRSSELHFTIVSFRVRTGAYRLVLTAVRGVGRSATGGRPPPDDGVNTAAQRNAGRNGCCHTAATLFVAELTLGAVKENGSQLLVGSADMSLRRQKSSRPDPPFSFVDGRRPGVLTARPAVVVVLSTASLGR